MPHSSKKKKNSNRNSRAGRPINTSHTTTYIIVGVVAAVILASAGLYVYSTQRSTTTLSDFSSSTATTTGSLGNLIYAKIVTSQGTMVVELFESLTPKTVNNFVSLANSGFYNGLVWHRIVKQPAGPSSSAFYLIQTGDPTTKNGAGNPCSWGSTGSSQTIPLEIDPSLHNDVGYLGMARTSSPSSASSQFYINLTNNTSLDGSYAVFGRVISGLSVAQSIDNLAINPNCQGGQFDGPPQNPLQAIVNSITIQSSP